MHAKHIEEPSIRTSFPPALLKAPVENQSYPSPKGNTSSGLGGGSNVRIECLRCRTLLFVPMTRPRASLICGLRCNSRDAKSAQIIIAFSNCFCEAKNIAR